MFGLGKFVLSSVLSHHNKNLKQWTDQCYSPWMDQCYSRMLQFSFIQKVEENTSSRHAGGPTQKTRREAPSPILGPLFICFFSPLPAAAAAAAELLQSCPTLCNPIDGSPPDSLSLEFSRQEHWRFTEPTPVGCHFLLLSELLQSCPTLCDPIDGSPPDCLSLGCHFLLQCMRVKSESEVLQSCLTPSDPMDCSLPGFSVHWIFQARVLEWGAIAFSVLSLGLSYIDWATQECCLSYLRSSP